MTEPRELTEQEKVAIRDATYQTRIPACCGYCRHSKVTFGFVCSVAMPRREVDETGWCAMWEGK